MGAYSKLHNETYRRLKLKFPEFVIRENTRPCWLVSSNLTRLELDLFIENIETAIEIQGMQHYVYTPHFHKSYQDFKEQQKRDREKRDICGGNGVRLVEIATYTDLDLFIKELEQSQKVTLQNSEKYFYSTPRRYSPKRPKTKVVHKRSLMSYRTYRRRIKNKMLRERGLLPPLEPKRLCIGNYKQRLYARKFLKIESINEFTWHVWGGHDEHIIKLNDDGFACDCWHNVNTKGICTHIIKVMWSRGIEYR